VSLWNEPVAEHPLEESQAGARNRVVPGSQTSGATLVSGESAVTSRPIPELLMEEMTSEENYTATWRKFRRKDTSPGIDGMTVKDLEKYLEAEWPQLREQLLQGKYRPQALKRKRISKPGGGERELGIPTMADRFVQALMVRVLSKYWDATFSESSYGFRPNRSQHQAVEAAQRLIESGRRWVVDLDLEKFFDRINHDRLLAHLAKRVMDKRVLKLIRLLVTAGAMENGLTEANEEGAPQGGPLSPFLSNVVLDELDRELEKRNLPFVRYADDCNIYVQSRRAGERVMQSITRFVEKQLRLKVNRQKSAVSQPWKRKLLGFSFTSNLKPKRRIATEAIRKFKKQIRKRTKRTRNQSLEQLIEEGLTPYLRGWRSYFGFCQTPSVLKELDSWIRRRLRSWLWKQWENGRRRFGQLVQRGTPVKLASWFVGQNRGPWPSGNDRIMAYALPPRWFSQQGLFCLEQGK
jgi:RNA-directed DNA polymerase